MARSGVSGINGAAGEQGTPPPKPSELGEWQFQLPGWQKMVRGGVCGGRVGSVCMRGSRLPQSLPLGSRPPFLGCPLPPRRDSRLAPEALQHILRQAVGLATLVGVVCGAQGPRTPRPKTLLQLCESRSWGPLCVWCRPLYLNTKRCHGCTNVTTLALVLCPGHAIALLVSGS